MISRRRFLATTSVGSAWAVARAAVPAPHEPTRPRRVFAAGPPAAVLVHVLAPDSLLGWPSRLTPEALAWLEPAAARLPVLGRLAGRGTTVSLETLVRLAPHLILDVGTVDANRTSTAARTQAQTGLRVELLDGRLADSPALLRRAGTLLEVAERGERLAAEAERLLAEVARARQALGSVRTYLARGADGLETGLGGSINVEGLELTGARNVAAAAGRGGISRVSMEQILAWDPEVVITQDPALARALRANPLWQGLEAVRAGRLLCAPSHPFGWLDNPPGINRLIGVLWLSRRLGASGGQGDDLRARVRGFYEAFYRMALTEAQLDQLLRDPA